MTAVLYVFEGIDGSGKSTQARLFAAHLRRDEKRSEVVEVREPGGTPLGESVRGIVLDPTTTDLDVRAELFLFMAARAQLCADVILPALSRGATVVADRYLWSSVVYQGLAAGLGLEPILQIGRFATHDAMPELTFLVDLDPTVATTRLGSVRDRIERRGIEFARRVRDGYLELARRFPDRFVVVDGSGEPAVVHNHVLEAWREQGGS